MGLLDLTAILLRFPQDAEDKETTLLMEIDITGDIYLTLPSKIEASIRASKAFSGYWEETDKKNFINLLKKIFANWQDHFNLGAKLSSDERKLEEQFKAILKRSEDLERFFKDTFNFLKEKSPFQDVSLLEVNTKQQGSSIPFVTTQINWKGNFAQVVTPSVLDREDVFVCHKKAVELALSIKSGVADSLVTLLKRVTLLM